MTTLEYMREKYAHYIEQMAWWRDAAPKETSCTKEYMEMSADRAMERAAYYAEAVKALELAEQVKTIGSGEEEDEAAIFQTP